MQQLRKHLLEFVKEELDKERQLIELCRKDWELRHRLEESRQMNFDDRDPRVGMTIGMTVNLGNFQSLKMSIMAEIDCLDDDPTMAMDELQAYLSEQLHNRMNIVREQIT